MWFVCSLDTLHLVCMEAEKGNFRKLRSGEHTNLLQHDDNEVVGMYSGLYAARTFSIWYVFADTGFTCM